LHPPSRASFDTLLGSRTNGTEESLRRALFRGIFLFYGEEPPTPEDVDSELAPLVEQLFTDAGVECERRNARGDGYRVVDAAIYEFEHWFDMPWES